jgi:hypothetical protein
MEINIENLTGPGLQSVLKLVEERDHIDKDVLALAERRKALSQQITATIAGHAPKTAHNGKPHSTSAVAPKASVKPKTAAAPKAHAKPAIKPAAKPTPKATPSKPASKPAAKPASKPATSATKPSRKGTGFNLLKGQRKQNRLPAPGTAGDNILKALREAGTKGSSIKEIATKFHLRSDTVSKWLAVQLEKPGSGLTRPSLGKYVLAVHASADKAVEKTAEKPAEKAD